MFFFFEKREWKISFLKHPWELRDAYYQQHPSLQYPPLLKQYFAYFQTQLETVRDNIPFLTQENLYQLQPNQLVKFKCMVQDIWDEEYFQYQISLGNNQSKTSLFRETVQISDVCVSICFLFSFLLFFV